MPLSLSGLPLVCLDSLKHSERRVSGYTTSKRSCGCGYGRLHRTFGVEAQVEADDSKSDGWQSDEATFNITAPLS
jgi:hypothetical protein